MKYIELKSKLKSEIKNVYLISGEDRFLCYDALQKIESAVSISIKDMNSVTISGENATAREIVDSANIYPFGDNFRLVVVKNYDPKKDENERKIIQDYLNAPLTSTVLVFFNLDSADNFKQFKNLEIIDCSKMNQSMISLYIKNNLAKNDIKSNDDAINKLILYCMSDMSRITNELEKLMAYVADTKVITADIVENYVTEDREFQVYKLAEYIAQGDSVNAVRLIDGIMTKQGMGLTILAPLYNNYRRLLFLIINKEKTTEELSALLGTKEFAIKMLKNQSQIFSAKQVKKIVDMIADYERKIKVGEIKESVAIKTIVFNILNIRGKNGR